MSVIDCENVSYGTTDDDGNLIELHNTEEFFEAFLGTSRSTACCFFCGDKFSRFLVDWKGCADEQALLLHPRCAQRLALHLAKDGLLAEAQEMTEVNDDSL